MATARMVRTTETTVTFTRSFLLSNIQGAQLPGTYRILADDEEISGDAFLAYRRLATTLHIPVLSPVTGCAMVVLIDADELELVLSADEYDSGAAQAAGSSRVGPRTQRVLNREGFRPCDILAASPVTVS